MGHVSLHYGRTEDGPVAAKLLSMLGYVETQALPLPDGSTFYRFVVDPHHHARGDGIVYLSKLPPAAATLISVAREALGVGTTREHPAVAELRAAIEADPEYTFHLGILLDSLEELERVTALAQDANEHDPELKGRLKIVINRPRPDDQEVEARLNASPIFGKVTRQAYGRNGVQVFVETDVIVSGTLTNSMILELDYVFPDKGNHILSVVEL